MFKTGEMLKHVKSFLGLAPPLLFFLMLPTREALKVLENLKGRPTKKHVSHWGNVISFLDLGPSCFVGGGQNPENFLIVLTFPQF